MNQAYQICTRCVMDTTDPEISFDVNGVCNHCHTYDRLQANVYSGEEGKRRLEKIVNKVRNEGKGKEYDCIIGVSGGVDKHIFVAYQVKKLGLRPLAVHLDNGWDSENSCQ